MKHSDALKAAKEIISKPENWTQGWYYKDSNEDSVASYEEATCFCSYGALRKANGIERDDVPGVTYLLSIVKTDSVGKWDDVVNYNDTHSHAEVMELFDKAIALAEKEGE